MARIALVSFRLGGTDGVSIEAAKWQRALQSLGHHVVTIAGEGDCDILVPGLAINAAVPPSHKQLDVALANVDLVVVENVISLPLNEGARDALYRVLENRAAIFHHHDLAWQREHLAHLEGPRDSPTWYHVTINDLSRRELKERGIDAVTIRNSFDCDPPRGNRETTRQKLGVRHDTRLLVMPTRAIPRKNVRGALQLARDLHAVLWMLGPVEDGYDEELTLLLHEFADVEVLRENTPTDIHDAYAASDLVVMASTWEGFGNPVLESVTHQRALALNHYPVAHEILDFGFSFFTLDDIEEIEAYLSGGDKDFLRRNLTIARQHFNEADLAPQLNEILFSMGLGTSPLVS